MAKTNKNVETTPVKEDVKAVETVSSFQVKKENAPAFLEAYRKQNPANYEEVKAKFEKHFGVTF